MSNQLGANTLGYPHISIQWVIARGLLMAEEKSVSLFFELVNARDLNRLGDILADLVVSSW